MSKTRDSIVDADARADWDSNPWLWDSQSSVASGPSGQLSFSTDVKSRRRGVRRLFGNKWASFGGSLHKSVNVNNTSEVRYLLCNTVGLTRPSSIFFSLGIVKDIVQFG